VTALMMTFALIGMGTCAIAAILALGVALGTIEIGVTDFEDWGQ
jgi:hypothetical protein